MVIKAIFNVLLTATLLPYSDSGSINWRNDLEKAKTEALNSWKPILLLFTSKNCGNCKSYLSSTFSSDDILQISKDYIFVNIDLFNKQLDKVKQFGSYTISGSIPHTSFILPNGSELTKLRHVGMLKPNELKKRLQELSSTIPWVTFDIARSLTPKLVRPVIIISPGNDKQSKDLLFDIDITKSYAGISHKFIWVKETDQKDDSLDIRIVDPFQKFEVLHKFSNKKDFTLHSLQQIYSEFQSRYIPENSFFCTECENVTDDTTCCGVVTKRILTFYCDICGKAYNKSVSCCGKVVQPVIQQP